MQWLINIILEIIDARHYATEAWVLAKNYATQAWVQGKNYATQIWVIGQHYLDTSFVYRTPAADWDWEKIDFTRDGNWHTLDCSAIVPAGAKAILFNQYANCTTVHKTFFLRYPNDPQWFACPGLHTQLSGVGIDRCNVVACSPTRHVEYRFTSAVWVSAYLTILGWWL